ncbi:MAG: insulinase family protein, partial [Gemmatimonadales bacterium]
RGDVPEKNLATVAHRPESEIYLLDRPGAQQSVIFAGHLAPPQANPDEIAIETMNTVLGGEFISRVNMNLREDKHWSYGAASLFFPARGQRPFIVYAPVQSDKTGDAMAEIYAELSGIRGDNPVTAEELRRVKDSKTLVLPGQWETAGAVLGSIQQIVEFGLPDDYFATYSGAVRALGLDDVNQAAQNTLRPDNLIWVVVGDKTEIEPALRALGYGEVYEIDADGNRK